MNEENKPAYAEIVSSSLANFTAQCWQWNIMPSFGMLVEARTAEYVYLGLVYHIEIGSLDATRVPHAYQKTAEELQAEHPHIFAFLRTFFSVVIVGYRMDGVLHLITPPTPPFIHTFVHDASPETWADFFARSEYVPLIFSRALPNVDELFLAMLARYVRYMGDKDLLRQFMQTYMHMVGSDYQRIRMFARRVERVVGMLA